MRRLLIALFVLGTLGPTPQFCAGAMAAQERATPPGEWCQRPESPMPKGAHACACHQADCTDLDPNKSSAHTDPQCLNYCTIPQCACPSMDCQ